MNFHGIHTIQYLYVVVDLHSKILDAHPLSNFLHFHAFFGKFWPHNWGPLWEILDLPWYYIIEGFTVKSALSLISTVVLIIIISQ